MSLAAEWEEKGFDPCRVGRLFGSRSVAVGFTHG
jgi:hypothetical protein